MPHRPVIEDVKRKVAREVVLWLEHPRSVHLQNCSLRDLGACVTFRSSYTFLVTYWLHTGYCMMYSYIVYYKIVYLSISIIYRFLLHIVTIRLDALTCKNSLWCV